MPAAAGKKKISSRIFFLKKNRRYLKKLEIWGRGSKAISEGVGVVLKARGGHKIFFQRGVAPLQPHPLLTYGLKILLLICKIILLLCDFTCLITTLKNNPNVIPGFFFAKEEVNQTFLFKMEEVYTKKNYCLLGFKPLVNSFLFLHAWTYIEGCWGRRPAKPKILPAIGSSLTPCANQYMMRSMFREASFSP